VPLAGGDYIPGVATKHQPIRYEQERQYPMSVEEAWRILADTDHLNRSIGLPAVEFSPFSGAGDPLVRQASARAFRVVPVRWKEFPFDWVRERRYAVRREFESGPIDWLEGGIELEPADNGVRVKAFAYFMPSNVTGRFLWRLGRAPVTGLLEFCDLYLSRKAAGKADPVPVPNVATAVDRQRLDSLIERLARLPVQQELIPLLRERVLEGSDDQLTSVRAFALADVWGAERSEVLRLFLHAARAGLFELRWDLMCPNCRIAKAEVNTLAELPPQFHCETCGISYAADLDQRVELRFSINPAIRSARDEIYCIGGPLRMPHVVAQQYLSPHEERRVDLALTEALLLRTIGGTQPLSLVRGPANSRLSEVKVSYAGGRWVGPHSLLEEGSLTVPDGAVVTLRNQTDGSVLALLEKLEWTRDATTAAEASTLQDFRDLFGSEVLAPGQQLAVRHIALLFSGLEGSTRLYEQLGDGAAYSRINRHFDFIKDVVARTQGTLVKTIGDATMCAFHRVEDAVEAALAIQQELVPWCAAQEIDPPLTVQLGLHHGPVIATTANNRLDYLGQTANVAAWLRDESRGGDIVLLPETLEQLTAPTLQDRTDTTLEPFTARTRLRDSEQQLVRLTVRPRQFPPSSSP
jgi:adenylate cyclase